MKSHGTKGRCKNESVVESLCTPGACAGRAHSIGTGILCLTDGAGECVVCVVMHGWYRVSVCYPVESNLLRLQKIESPKVWL